MNGNVEHVIGLDWSSAPGAETQQNKSGPKMESTGKRTRGRPKNFWRCDHIADKEVVGYSWGEKERMAQDRRRWRAVDGGLCPSRT